ncbi:ATP-dependent serine peptidase containing a PDZ domain protein [Agrococcus sediminis]|uniref:endopeptidase La n=1 Tax=Agrococcus sediminis TaxID=2599924 RepID=A0A5M8QCT5_9MICO|nr:MULTISPECIES: S16 family serine protease [Agrococcus]KAA6432978.1 ATP-dependent serine peptidase containing a PDZ domain protein [Agrococcus sediminis]MDR7234260.1 PDZ domain-containing protein [Agrococcus sp. BE272]RWR25811.1 ATP-dependent serine peptidase containing a PDZ domain protein [Agrococcus lahaulensis]UOW00932.1 ATP-dependent serine peptidase containing a PDZ domain protein [Agrococcus sp. SCSIO52902]
MSEPAGIAPLTPSAVREQHARPRFPDIRPRRLRRIGWVGLAAAGAASLALAFVPSPYVVEVPGPTFDTLGETDAGPLISIEGVETYPTEGELRLLTVSLFGNPERPLTWVDVAEAYLDPSDSIIPMDAAFPPDVSVQDSNEAGRIEMQNSQAAAIAAALLHEGYPVDSDVRVAGVIDGSPAEGVLREDDRILRVNGDTAYDVWSIRESIAAVDGATSFEIERDGEPLTVEVTPLVEGDQRLVGIYPANEFEFPFEVDIQLPNVGGPSAGMMFALGIVDELTPGALTAGTQWAGTGTISALGDVGGIGGIVQKMHGAVDAGATHFLAPADNCGEVVGHVPEGLTVYAVETLDDAIAAVEAVAMNADTSGLPVCGAAPAS